MSASLSFYTVLFCFAVSLLTSALAIPLEARSNSGKATWFNVGLGACGKTNVDSDWIVALSASAYGNGNHCGKFIKITDKGNGKTAKAMVRDKCPSCAYGDLDMSPSLFSHFENKDKGVFQVSWNFA